MKKHIYIIQMHTGTIFSRIIRLITQYEYSHIALSLDKNCNNIYSFGRRGVRNIFNAGFVKETQNGKFFTTFDKTTCRIYELEVSSYQYRKLKRILKDMSRNPYKYGYDYIGIFLRLFKIDIEFKDKYVCSQFIASLLENTNTYHFNKKTNFIKPQDFENISNTINIYNGMYNLYGRNSKIE